MSLTAETAYIEASLLKDQLDRALAQTRRSASHFFMADLVRGRRRRRRYLCVCATIAKGDEVLVHERVPRARGLLEAVECLAKAKDIARVREEVAHTLGQPGEAR